jgi:NAD(P)-dependent dehydrogenase (short-subunit alcohol dehydrogenase family)
VVGLSLAWRVAADPHGVGIHVVCPGGIDTPMLDKVAFPGVGPPGGRGAIDAVTGGRDGSQALLLGGPPRRSAVTGPR